MAFLLSLLACGGIFLWADRLFQRAPLIPYLDSLRIGRAHQLFIGIFIGMALPIHEMLFRQIDILRHEFLNIGLVWFGFQTGLAFDLQRLRRLSLKTIAAQLTITMTTIGFSVLGVLASGQILYTHLGLKTDLPLAVLVLASFAATIRFPEPTFRWHKQALPPPSDAIADLPLANVIAVLFLGLASPLFSHTFSMPSDTLSLLGLSRNFPLLLIVGLLGGMALDFVLRAHRQIRRGVGLAFGIIIVLSGLSHTLSIPALTVGLIGGIWLVNSTVAKRDVLQFASRASGVIEPLFFLFLGSLIGGYGGGVFFEAGLLVPLALLLLLFRTIGRMIGLVISQHAWLLPKTWREVMDLSWRPMDILSAAIGVQGLFLLQLSHNTLIAAMILATLLTQGLIFPPRQQPKRTTSATTPTGT